PNQVAPYKQKISILVQKLLDEPGAGHAIYLDVFTSKPLHSTVLLLVTSTAKRTKIDAKRDGLFHLAFLIDGNTTTGQKDVEALPQCIKGSGVRPQLGLDLLIDPHIRGVDHVDHTWV